jgi:hypothetical protein
MGSLSVGASQTGNNSAPLSDNNWLNSGWILNITVQKPKDVNMKHLDLPLAFGLMIGLALPAHAAGCYADYKAKQDDPLRLHYGVAQINGACDARSAAAELAPRLAAQGWTLLHVVSTFGDGGLDQRKDSAGQNYLRF